MMLGETFRVALDALRANKLRSLLTMLGIVIGVAAVIAMVALGQGAQKAVNARIAALGTTLLTVSPGQGFGPGRIASASDRAELSIDDSEALLERGTTFAAVQPEMSRSLQVQYQGKNTNTTIAGVTPNYLEVRIYTIGAGRMFTEGDDAARRRVAVVGSQVLTDLGLPTPQAILGQKVRIGGGQFEVIGVLASKGQGAGFGNPDDQVLIPIQTARYRLMGGDRLRSVSVLARNEAEIPATMAEIQKILRREHRLDSDQADDFSIRSQADFLNTLGETTQVFTLLLAGIATVSLLVGGIGIMNIMLVSVTERTREIGLRKAIGATRENILLQFLIEAVVLCVLGGLVGIGLGAGAATLMHVAWNWNTSVDWTSVAVAFAFSGVIGVLFGVWPARRAAGFDPIEALRYE
ncbi:MAG: ABC transporter permease [Candidatus Eisenbacteria bacterium]|nr:ABC transporter permease [Candidatus Eisenbacteria bacterium]